MVIMELLDGVALTTAVTVRRFHVSAPNESRTPMSERNRTDIEFSPDMAVENRRVVIREQEYQGNIQVQSGTGDVVQQYSSVLAVCYSSMSWWFHSSLSSQNN